MSLFAVFDPDPVRLTAPQALAVRSATPDDAPSMARLHAQREGSDPREAEAKIRSELERLPDSETNHVFIATVPDASVGDALVGDALVGYARVRLLVPSNAGALHAVPAGWYLLGVVVDTNWRRRGLGAALTRARLEWAAERTSQVRYFVSARNRASIALHARFGFREVARNIVVPSVTFTGGIGVLFEWRRGEDPREPETA